MKHCQQEASITRYNNTVKTFSSILSTIFLSPFLILGELQTIMALIDDLKAAIATLSGQVDTVLANESADAAAVADAQAKQAAAEAATVQAQADLATAQAALAEAQANAVTQAEVDSVTAISNKIVPPAAPEAPAQ